MPSSAALHLALACVAGPDLPIRSLLSLPALEGLSRSLLQSLSQACWTLGCGGSWGGGKRALGRWARPVPAWMWG